MGCWRLSGGQWDVLLGAWFVSKCPNDIIPEGTAWINMNGESALTL